MLMSTEVPLSRAIECFVLDRQKMCYHHKQCPQEQKKLAKVGGCPLPNQGMLKFCTGVKVKVVRDFQFQAKSSDE